MVVPRVERRMSRQGGYLPVLKKQMCGAGKNKIRSVLRNASDAKVDKMLASIFENKQQARRCHPFYCDRRGYNISVNLFTCSPYEFVAATVPFGGAESGNLPLLAERPPQHKHIDTYVYDDDAIMRDLTNMPKWFKGNIL